jgi:hypothetical protein
LSPVDADQPPLVFGAGMVRAKAGRYLPRGSEGGLTSSDPKVAGLMAEES